MGTACNVLLDVCADAKPNENILLVSDTSSREIANNMWQAAKDFHNKTLIEFEDRSMHGQEPPSHVSQMMAQADVIFGITKFSLFHTNARRNATGNGARFINMVDYSPEMLTKGGLFIDFIEQGKVLDQITKKFSGSKIQITTKKGTKITASILGRPPVPQYGRSLSPGDASSPPDIECAVGPVEDTAEGVLIVDGSIPHPKLGLIHEEIKLVIEGGRIIDVIGGDQAQTLQEVLREFQDDNVYRLGEIGIGLNPGCSLSGRMLEDEGCFGTVHFGFGSNISFGGIIESQYHLDMVFTQPTISVDGHDILSDGMIAD